MQVREAKRAARDWVLREAIGRPGFQGAYVAGSANWLPDDANLSTHSDLDVTLVFDRADGLTERRKILHEGVLLEFSTLPLDRVRTPEQVLGDFALAGGFRVPSVLADPTGHLTALQVAVARRIAEPGWVRRRCEHARSRSLAYLDGMCAGEDRPLYYQVIGWAFGTSVTTLIPLVAALRNPTVRRRYVAVRELLADYGRLDLCERMLDTLGCAALSRAQVEQHLATLAGVYDATVPVLKSPFPFAADISALSRHIAVDGSQELIEAGLHREAVFWPVVTYARCLQVLMTDAPELGARCETALRTLLADLGVPTFADLQASAERTRALLPEVWQAAERIIAELPGARTSPCRSGYPPLSSRAEGDCDPHLSSRAE